MGSLGRAGERLYRLLFGVLATAIVGAVALNFSNVVARYVFGAAIVGAEELQIYAMVAVTFLGAALVAWRDQHLRMDVVRALVRRTWQQRIAGAEGVLVVALSAFVAWISAGYALQLWRFGQRSDALAIPSFLPHLLVAVGFVLVALAQLVRIFQPASTEPGYEPAPAAASETTTVRDEGSVACLGEVTA